MIEVFDVPQGITGELREKLAEYEPQETSDEFRTRPVGAVGYDIMTALCDSIDAVHASLERENAELKAELDRVLGERMTEPSWGYVDDLDPEMMAEHGWYRALDADNVPWRIGDRDENGDEVTSISVSYVIADGRLPRRPSIHRHYHAPTVEDVLREFAHVGIHIAAKHGIKAGEIDFYADEEAIAEFAAKLRLAGDAE